MHGYVISQHKLGKVILFLLGITILLTLIKTKSIKSVGENQDRRYTETDREKEMDIILIISSSRLQNLEQKKKKIDVHVCSHL